jgi:hypothetical protein
MRRTALFLLAAAAAWAQPRIVYSKAFPGSHPPFVLITLDRDGKGVYRESENDEQPLPFELKKEEVDEIFGLAEKVGKFERPLESGLKIANLGKKKFRWEENGKKSEVELNYSQDPDAQVLVNWFEKMTETEQHFIAVERAVKFDKLGANKTLLQMQAAMERNRLVALKQFLPLLTRVTANQSFLHMDRDRAAKLIDWIENGRPKADQP